MGAESLRSLGTWGRRGALLACSALFACSVGVPLPPGEVEAIAQDMLSLGHPMAKYESSRIVSLSTGDKSKEVPASVDLAVDYVAALSKQTQTMTVRLEVLSLDPCKVRSNVVGDTGKGSPVLLDNAVAAPLVGNRVCAAFR